MQVGTSGVENKCCSSEAACVLQCLLYDIECVPRSNVLLLCRVYRARKGCKGGPESEQYSQIFGQVMGVKWEQNKFLLLPHSRHVSFTTSL